MQIKTSDIQVLQFELTSYCNAMCVHCPRFSQIDHDVFESVGEVHQDLTLSHVDVDKIIKNLDLPKLVNLKKIIIEGDKGDPLMHPNLERLIDAFSTMDSPPLIFLTTNGSIRNKEWWINLAKKKYPTLRVIFSIDGLDDTNHLYRVGLDFKTIIDNVSGFINNGGFAIWKMIVFKHNEHQISEIQKLSKNMGFRMFKTGNGDVNRFKNKPNWPVTYKDKTWYIEPAEHTYNIEEYFNENDQEYYPRYWNPYKDRLCPNLRNGQIYINHLNQIVPCCMMHFDTELNYFGKAQLLNLMENFDNYDLSKHTLEYILNQEFYKNKLQDSLKNGNMHYTCEKSCGNIIAELRKNEN